MQTFCPELGHVAFRGYPFRVWTHKHVSLMYSGLPLLIAQYFCQWSSIVLGMERMLNPAQRIAMQRAYSQKLTTTGERALVMRLHKHEDYNQVTWHLFLHLAPSIVSKHGLSVLSPKYYCKSCLHLPLFNNTRKIQNCSKTARMVSFFKRMTYQCRKDYLDFSLAACVCWRESCVMRLYPHHPS